jgi:ABC-2 type transport system permease protein
MGHTAGPDLASLPHPRRERRMFTVEIAKAWHRPRTWVFAAGLALLAALPVIVLRGLGASGQGGVFFEEIRHSGLFAALAAVALIQPFFLPLGTALLSGESIAGEASVGTLRYLLARPVGRRRLVALKYATVMAELAASVVWVMVLGLVAGGIAFGFGELPTLSGITISAGAGLLRILAAAAYVVAGSASVAAIGVFFSTLTDAGLGVAGGTIALAITSQVLDNLSSLRAIHPYLFTDKWLAWTDLFRSPVAWNAMARGVLLDVVYTGLFLGGAMLVFSRRDVVS